MKRTKLLLLISIMLLSSELFSQMTLDGEFRPRMMIDGGYKTIRLQSDPALVYISQRSRVNLGYKSEKLETYFSVQDVHFWGDDDVYSSSSVSGNTKGINLYQAWVSLKPTSDIAIKIGRQQLSYDDQRLLSARNWGEYQVTYDALLFTWNKGKSKLDAAAAWNTSGSSDALYPKGKIKLIDFARYELGVGKFNLSGIVLVSGNTKADTLTDVALTGSYGVNVLYKLNGFDARFSGYYQNALNKVNGDISAYCLSVFARKLFLNDKASLGIGADIYSGNDGVKVKSDETYKKAQHKFNSLYGNRHSLLGYMDYYTSIPDQGIQDYMVKTEYKLTKEVLLQADYHLFYLNNKGYDVVDTGQLADMNLGSELDFTLQWKVMKDVTLQTGYSFYQTTGTLEKWKKVYGKETRTPQFAYVMLTVKPMFFKSEK
jgi:hypothetical protein